MYQKAILATAVGFVLSIFGPIDEWSHFGSTFIVIAYCFFTCPTLQIDDSSSQKTSKDDGIRLVRRNVELASTKFELVLMKDEMAVLRQMVSGLPLTGSEGKSSLHKKMNIGLMIGSAQHMLGLPQQLATWDSMYS
ncbi:hypothetical protein L6452_39209 [Arctium lappa]|uniref:Uncharacterized protein n=1 Tax=Arctium lappa TaxID=4217 RepID=A0ACB8XTC9_ARCLA|nr:hypothetical protein L6452_39209 [Arctium lappa]